MEVYRIRDMILLGDWTGIHILGGIGRSRRYL
jgi:hypothetical protein